MMIGFELSEQSMAKRKVQLRRHPRFELLGGNVALDFVNTLDNRPSAEPIELLKGYSDLARFSEDSGILTKQQADYFYEHALRRPDEAEAVMRQARSLREALHDMFWALMNKKKAPQKAMDTLNGELHDAVLHTRLVQVGDRYELRFDEMTSCFRAILWPITRAAAQLLTSNDMALVRACSSPTCRWLFLDTSKNHHRRWCSMKLCGNRTKARRFYAKKKSA